ncbi:hypothetical protein [Massilia sp. BKSP1R2A-1]|uniref:hypothetical protein n=1 Tax=Massilia sp. BKSP1R2A-1 TaxID=3422595 RepID=UPI003D335ED7
MSKKFVAEWFYAALGTYKKQDGIIFKETNTYYTQRHVDFDSFAEQLAQKYEEFDRQGYDVVNVVPISMGQSESCTQSGGAYVGDVGFSITRGAVVVGKRRDS